MKKIMLLYLFVIPLIWAQEAAPETELDAVSIQSTAEIKTTDEIKIEEETQAELDENAPELDIEIVLRKCITEFAQTFIGVPYKYAGISPDGFDCSGFIYYVFRESAGMDVSRSSVGIWNSGTKVELNQVKPGDVLVFSTVRAGASHVGIVLENGPQGILFIHAASQGPEIGVTISNMNESYYKTRYMGARSYFQ